MAAVHVPRAAADAVKSSRASFWPILSLILFGIAFGYLEAAVVVYLRTLHGPLRVSAGFGARDLFPLLRLEQLPAETLALLKIELGREAATLIMIAAVAAAVSQRLRTWLAAFILVFGVWDLTFYLWLRVLIGWPASVLTWDILFLLPVPWAAPVLAPSIVAATMAIFGALLLARTGQARPSSRRETPTRSPAPGSVVRASFLDAREPERGPRYSGFLIAGGAVLQFASFIWDWRRWLTGGMPESYPWPLFALGETLIIAGFLSMLVRVSSSRPAIAQEAPAGDIETLAAAGTDTATAAPASLLPRSSEPD